LNTCRGKRFLLFWNIQAGSGARVLTGGKVARA
jgi:hypothetical protein